MAARRKSGATPGTLHRHHQLTAAIVASVVLLMSFARFRDQRVRDVIDSFGQARTASFIIGAGASAEANFPDWKVLVKRVLKRAGIEKGLFRVENDGADGDDGSDFILDEDALDTWVEETLRHDFLSGAASIAEQLLETPLEDCVRQELYCDSAGNSRDPFEIAPGPISREIAYCRAMFEHGVKRSLRLLTTNYDDLIIEALRERDDLMHYDVYPRVYPVRPPDPDVPLKVRHLHGYIGRDRSLGQLVLTDASYFGSSEAQAQRELSLTKSLSFGPCLFIGTSLTDFNLTRFLYRDDLRSYGHQHAVVFVRQSDQSDEPSEVREAREQAAIDTWGSQKLDVIFLDHFADVSQLLHEIGLRRELKAAYRRVDLRATDMIDSIHERLLGTGRGDEYFFKVQHKCNEQLRTILEVVVEEMSAKGLAIDSENLAAAVWLYDRSGTAMIPWIATDRVHREVQTLQEVDLNFPTRWVAVKAACGRVRVDEEVTRENSRWRYLIGLPLEMVDEQGCKTPMGAISVSSLSESSALAPGTENSRLQADFAQLLTTLVQDAITSCVFAV